MESVPSEGSPCEDPLELYLHSRPSSPSSIPATSRARLKNLRTLSTKYDFVKVKVYLDTGNRHYYVLSRFVLNRMLTATLIDERDAIKIALELKKNLVDSGKLSLTLKELDCELQNLLVRHGYGLEDPVHGRFRLISDCYIRKVSTIILMAMTRDDLMDSKRLSYVSSRLSELLNINVVLNTDFVGELIECIYKGYSPFALGKPAIIDSISVDINKCIDAGKPFIIQGSIVDDSTLSRVLHYLHSRKAPSGVVIPVRLLGKRSSFSCKHLDSSFSSIFFEDYPSEGVFLRSLHSLILGKLADKP